MFLKSITIRGFKSFARKSVIKLEPGATAIVGPNGSGKSNIVDAVLWVLGEQKPKSLRSSTMQDIIFSGTSTKQSLGVAEVSLNLDNSDGAIPIEYSEVTITRRGYRSGESNYYLNGTLCRLLDIQELLADSGLGREMYSIISQGKLGNILNCPPPQRRLLIEGAAGVIKHKQRKVRALRKLKSTDKNLIRLEDILGELNSRAEPLRRQAEAAKAQAELRNKEREIRVKLTLNRLRRYQNEWESVKQKTAAELDRERKLKDEIKEALATAAEQKCRREAQETTFNKLSEDRRRCETLYQQLKSVTRLLAEKRLNYRRRLNEVSANVDLGRQSLLDKRAELVDLTEEVKVIDKDLQNHYQALGRERKDAEALKKSSRALKERVRRAEREYAQTADGISKLKEEYHSQTSRQTAVSEQTAFLKEELDKTASALADVARQRRRLNEKINSLERKRKPLEAEVAKRQLKIDKLMDLAGSLKRRLEADTAALNTAQAGWEALRKVAEGLKSTSGRQSEILKNNRGDSGIIGAVAEMIEVEKRYEKAIEAALSADIYSLVTTDIKAAMRLITQAEAEKGEFISLVPAAATNSAAAEETSGVVPALSVVTGPASIKPALQRLLGRVLIVDDLAAAVERWPEYGPGWTLVGLNGDFVSDRGVIRRGVFSGDKAGYISSLREAAELEEKLPLLKRRAGEAKEKLAAAEEDLRREQEEVLELSAAIQEQLAAVTVERREMNHLKVESEALSRKKQELTKKIRAKGKLGSEGKAPLAAVSKEIIAAEKRLRATEKLRDELKNELNKERERETAAAATLNKLQVEIASLAERKIHLKRRHQSLQEELEQWRGQEETAARQSKDLEEAAARLDALEEKVKLITAAAENIKIKLDSAASTASQHLSELKAAVQISENKRLSALAEQEKIREKLTNYQVKLARTETKVQESTSYLTNELNLTLTAALKQYGGDDGGNLSSELAAVKERLAELGEVNPMALSEYEQLDKRRQFLKRQIDDLKAGRLALKKIISAIEERITAKFSATFTQVNQHFQAVFSELFPGGRVGLLLTEADDEGEAGVVIEAQPAGKKLKSLSLLSGGERSLVGLALLFAVFYTRPGPFYILDEVEAALDDINIGRFINLINKLKATTQFLIITHQRRTMEAADLLYGVTMGADGVSKLVSQKMEDGENGAQRGELADAVKVGSSQITE